MMEAEGFDGGYSGIQNYMFAAGWIVSGDKFDPSSASTFYDRDWDFLADALDRQHDFWSHFMTPSDSGTMTAFGHDSDSRTAIGAVQGHYHGGKVIESISSDMVARLLLEDGTDRATKLLASSEERKMFLCDDLPVKTDIEAPKWRDETLDNNFNNPLSREGAKFDLMPLYVGGAGHIFGSNGPIDRGAEFPCEVVVASSIEIEEIKEAYIAINTPCYYTDRKSVV